MYLRRLIAAVLALGLVAACSDDDGAPTGPDEVPSLSGTVTNLIYEGEPVAGIGVAVDDTTYALSGPSGQFALEGVEGTYDLVASVPVPTFGGHILTGYSGMDLTAPDLGAIPAGWNSPRPRIATEQQSGDPLFERSSTYTQDAAEISGTVTDVDGSGGAIQLSIGDGERGNVLTQSASSPSYSGFDFTWAAEPSRTVSVAALQRRASGEYWYRRMDGITLARNSTGTTVDLDLDPLSTTDPDSIEVSIDPPTGMAIGSATWEAYVVINGLIIQTDGTSGTSATLHYPVMSGATHVVTVNASIEDGTGTFLGNYTATRPGLTLGSTLDLTVPDMPSLSAPADGASGVSVRPTFEYSAAPGTSRNLLYLLGSDPYSSNDQTWLVVAEGDTSQIGLPSSSAVNAELHANSDYEWSVLSVVEGDIDAANSLLIISMASQPYLDLSILTGGPITLLYPDFSPFHTVAIP